MAAFPINISLFSAVDRVDRKKLTRDLVETGRESQRRDADANAHKVSQIVTDYRTVQK